MGTLKRLANANKKPSVPVHDDPREELRRLVKEHAAITKRAVALINMSSDKVNRETGEVAECLLPKDEQTMLQDTAKQLQKSAKRLETPITRQLRQVPIYKLFLRNVFGVGPLTAAYLIANVDIGIATKPSNLQRFCGLGMPGGGNRLDRPTKGQKNPYSKEMRTRMYLCMTMMRQTAGGSKTSKYLDRWAEYKHRMQSSRRIDWKHNLLCDCGDEPAMDLLREGKASVKKAKSGKKTRVHVMLDGESLCVVRTGAKGWVDATGRIKAACLLLEDLYTVWRALEGLPVWPDYHAGKLGYGHGGKVAVNEPRMLSVEEALELVGDVGAIEASAA